MHNNTSEFKCVSGFGFHRAGLLFFIFSIFVSGIYVFLNVRHKSPAIIPEIREAADPFLYENADPRFVKYLRENVLDVLAKESLEESIRRLDDIDFYVKTGIFPGSSHTVKFPVELAEDKTDVYMIVANRRFLKVYSGLLKLSKMEIASLINGHLEESLSLYLKAFDKDIAIIKGFNPDPRVRPKFLTGYKANSNKDGSPTLLGLRYKIFALLLIAGNVKLAETRSAVEKVARAALNQYKNISDPNNFNASVGFNIALFGSIYNRQILATALSGVLEGDVLFKDALNKILPKFNAENVTGHDSLATQFDLYVKAGIAPIDYSRGSFIINYCFGVTDGELESLIDN